MTKKGSIRLLWASYDLFHSFLELLFVFEALRTERHVRNMRERREREERESEEKDKEKKENDKEKEKEKERKREREARGGREGEEKQRLYLEDVLEERRRGRNVSRLETAVHLYTQTKNVLHYKTRRQKERW